MAGLELRGFVETSKLREGIESCIFSSPPPSLCSFSIFFLFFCLFWSMVGWLVEMNLNARSQPANEMNLKSIVSLHQTRPVIVALSLRCT